MEAPLRTLVVDDSAVHAGLVVAALRGHGMEVTPARVSTRETMQAALEGQSWDIVIANDAIRSFDTAGVLELVSSMIDELPCIVVADHCPPGAEVDGLSLAWLGPAAECRLLQIQARKERRRKRRRRRTTSRSPQAVAV